MRANKLQGNIMEEQNELNDIILNKGALASSNKKIILAVATLGVILVIVVMLMNSLSSNGTDNLPQVALPPKPSLVQEDLPFDEPLFEDVEVVEEKVLDETTNLDNIAKKLKEESQKEQDMAPIVPHIKADDIVLDNCTGTSGFLVSSMKKMIEKCNGDLL